MAGRVISQAESIFPGIDHRRPGGEFGRPEPRLARLAGGGRYHVGQVAGEQPGDSGGDFQPAGDDEVAAANVEALADLTVARVQRNGPAGDEVYAVEDRVLPAFNVLAVIL